MGTSYSLPSYREFSSFQKQLDILYAREWFVQIPNVSNKINCYFRHNSHFINPCCFQFTSLVSLASALYIPFHTECKEGPVDHKKLLLLFFVSQTKVSAHLPTETFGLGCSASTAIICVTKVWYPWRTLHS